MRAVIVREPGGVEALEIADIPPPEPGAGELLIRNYAAALNRADLLQRRGLYPPPPGESEVLGLEFAGEVARAGPGVEGFHRGDRVFGLVGGGAYAEYLAVDCRLALRIPDTLSFDAAAAIPEAFFLAQEALLALARLRAGETVLIHAGGSGIGTAAIQVARAYGARVLVTAGAPAKLERCLALGADRAIDYRADDFVRGVKEETRGAGVDAILDPVGAAYWERNLAALADCGRLVVIGLLGGAKAEIDLGAVLRRRLQVIGTVLRPRSLDEKAVLSERFRRDLLPRFESGELRAVIDSVYPLEEVRAAHDRMERNLNAGKIILRL